MVSKLINQQIEAHWDVLKEGIRAGAPGDVPLSDVCLNTILHKLLRGDAQAWVGMLDNVIALIATTVIIQDVGEEEKHLLIYSLFGYSTITKDLWKEGQEKLAAFARSVGCKKITAFSDIPRVLEVAKDILGGDIKTRYIIWEV